MLNLLDIMIDNVFVRIGDNLYRQVVGIPMGTDCAPLLANLFLHQYEFKYMKKLMKTNFALALTFSDTFRYIDDLVTLNNANFEEHIPKIYPPSLILNKENESDVQATFLDIAIQVRDRKYVTSVYDKRDDFTFAINHFCTTDANVSFSRATNVFISQLVRAGRICSEKTGFLKKIKLTVLALEAKQHPVWKLRKLASKFRTRYPDLWSKFGISSHEFNNAVFRKCSL